MANLLKIGNKKGLIMEEQTRKPLNQYLIHFVGFYIGLYIALAIVVYLFKIDKFSAANVLITMISAMLVADSFIKTESRTPTHDEQKKLVWGSFFLMIMFELVVACLVVFSGGASELQAVSDSGHMGMIATILVVAVILFLLVDYFILRWIYGTQAQKMHTRIQMNKFKK